MFIVQGRQFYPMRQYLNLREMLRESGRLYGQRTAFTFRSDPASEPQSRTYEQFISDYQALGSILLDLGYAGIKAAVIGENSYNWCVAHTAILNGVGVSVPLDRLLPSDEIVALLHRGGVAAVFYDAAFHAAMLEAVAQNPGQIKLLCCMRPDKLKDPAAVPFQPVPDPTAVPARADQTSEPLFFRFEDLLTAGRASRAPGSHPYDEAPIDERAMASLLFTSGTTSASKAVMLSHHNICADIAGLTGIILLQPGTRMLSVLPLHHTFENTCGLFVALAYGCEIVICDGLRHIQKNLQEYQIDMIIGVPALFESFYNKVQDSLKKTGKERLVRKMIPLTQGLRKIGIDLRKRIYKQIIAAFGGRLALGICGAAPIDPEIIRFFDAVGLRILQGYGLTETSPVVTGCNDRDFRPGTVGYPISGVEIAVACEKLGEPGEILVRGPIVMSGYYQDATATAEAIDADGWFHTGDIGVLDPKDKYLTVTGRIKSMIVLKSGKKVFPEEIEHLINQNDFIKESLVWGDLDADGEVTVYAKIVLDRDRMQQKGVKATDEAELKTLLDKVIGEINRLLPSFKTVRHYAYSFQELVKTTTLKIRRPIEIARIQDLMRRLKLRGRELAGKNLDQLEGSATQSGEQIRGSDQLDR
jgi:long-chain acyl-CoA synthetase